MTIAVTKVCQQVSLSAECHLQRQSTVAIPMQLRIFDAGANAENHHFECIDLITLAVGCCCRLCSTCTYLYQLPSASVYTAEIIRNEQKRHLWQQLTGRQLAAVNTFWCNIKNFCGIERRRSTSNANHNHWTLSMMQHNDTHVFTRRAKARVQLDSHDTRHAVYTAAATTNQTNYLRTFKYWLIRGISLNAAGTIAILGQIKCIISLCWLIVRTYNHLRTLAEKSAGEDETEIKMIISCRTAGGPNTIPFVTSLPLRLYFGRGNRLWHGQSCQTHMLTTCLYFRLRSNCRGAYEQQPESTSTANNLPFGRKNGKLFRQTSFNMKTHTNTSAHVGNEIPLLRRAAGKSCDPERNCECLWGGQILSNGKVFLHYYGAASWASNRDVYRSHKQPPTVIRVQPYQKASTNFREYLRLISTKYISRINWRADADAARHACPLSGR